MICPDCRAAFDDRLEVCPECGAVVAAEESPSAPSMANLWNQQSGTNPDVTGPHQAVPDQPNLTGPFPVPGTQPAAEGEAAVGTRVVNLDPEAGRGTRVVEISLPPMVKKAARAQQQQKQKQKGGKRGSRAQRNLELEESGVSRTIDDLLRSLKMFYARLHRFDRWTVWILAATFVASFLPWCRVLSYGLTAGIQDYGLITAPLAAAAFSLVYFRTMRRRLTFPLLLLQLLVTAGMGAAVVWRYLSAANTTFTYGIYLTALCAALAVVATLLRTARVNV